MGDTRPRALGFADLVPDNVREWAWACSREANHPPDVALSANHMRRCLLEDARIGGHAGPSLGLPDAITDGQATVYGLLIAATSTWAPAQTIYRFDSTLAGQLEATPRTFLPYDVVRRMPYPCVWIEVEHCDGERSGVFALLDSCTTSTNNTPVLAIIGDGVAGFTELDSTVEAGVADAVNVEDAKLISCWASLLLYLCSEEPDITHKPSPMNEMRIRRGKSPYHPTIHHVGYRIGAAFRKAKAEREAFHGAGGHGASPAPHMRRAHWHTYWVGKENTPQRRQVVKWLPPIPVNVKSDDDIIPTIHKVKR